MGRLIRSLTPRFSSPISVQATWDPKTLSPRGAEAGLSSPELYLRHLLNNALFFFTNGNSQFIALNIICEFCDTCLAVLLHALLFFS